MLKGIKSAWANLSFASVEDLERLSSRQEAYHKSLSKRLDAENVIGIGGYFNSAGVYIRSAAKTKLEYNAKNN